MDDDVALVVSTDLWNERDRRPRYEQLHGKAAALGVTPARVTVHAMPVGGSFGQALESEVAAQAVQTALPALTELAS